MQNLSLEFQNNPTNNPIKINFVVDLKPFSQVKLFIPKIHNLPTIAVGKRWYVYYYFRHPETKKMIKFTETCKLNKYKTIKERKQYGKIWVDAITSLLHQGFNPFSAAGIEIEPEKIEVTKYSVSNGIKYALHNLQGTWKESTANDYKTRANLFIQWATANEIDNFDINSLTELHIITFFNWLVQPMPNGRGVGLTSQDNYKRCLSALFNKLVRDKIIIKNFVAAIETKKNKPKKNAPFTGKEVAAIKIYLMQNDIKLYHFIQFIIYAFLRPVEICRLTIGSIKLDQKTLTVETKTERQKVKKLIKPIVDFLTGVELHKYPKKAHLFTMQDIPELWDASEKTKVDYFASRFRAMKNALGLGTEYGIYSFRHTAAIDLYYSFLKQGFSERETILKLMPITGHVSEAALSKYLRDVGGMLPKDYADDYTLNF